MWLTWILSRRVNEWAAQRRQAGSRSIWTKQIGYASDDFSRRNQIHKSIQVGVGLVLLAVTGSTIGFGEGNPVPVPGGWPLWVGLTVGLYLVYLLSVRPWSAEYCDRKTKALASSGLSEETKAWLAGAPAPHMPATDTTEPTTKPDPSANAV